MLPRRHIPNAITIARLVLTAACIATLSLVVVGFNGAPLRTEQGLHDGIWLYWGLGLFIAAALTDWLDGYLARRWQVVSQFGRVMDPLADKVLVLGTFTVLCGMGFIAPESGVVAGEPVLRLSGWASSSGVQPWMVVLMLTRELLVTGLRSAMESSGTAFGAVTLGKLKMVLQSITIPVILVIVAFGPYEPGHGWMVVVRDVLLYATVIVTVLSAWPYVAAAVRFPSLTNADTHEVNPHSQN